MTPRLVLITGGTGKIGTSLVAHFLACGDQVITTGRSEASLAKLRGAHAATERLHLLTADFSAADSVARLVATVTERGLRPQVLINNARSLDFLGISEDGTVPRKNFLGEYLIDVVVPYELTMALAAHPLSCLRHVVNIGSQYGLVAANPALYVDPLRQSPIHYGVAKAALGHLTRELAVRLATRQIRVNCIAFGGVEGRVDDAFKARYAALCPQGRMLDDSELAGPVEMLLSNNCSAITGQVIAADGGWSLW